MLKLHDLFNTSGSGAARAKLKETNCGKEDRAISTANPTPRSSVELKPHIRQRVFDGVKRSIDDGHWSESMISGSIVAERDKTVEV